MNDTKEKITKEKAVSVFCVLALAGLGVFLAVQSSLMPFTRDGFISTDTSVWIQIAKEMQHGKMVYRDLFDHKGPVLFFLFSLFFRFGGITGIWILQCLMLAVTITMCMKCAMTITSNRLLGTYVTVATVWGLNYFFWEDLSIEEMALPFLFTSLYIFLSYFRSEDRRIKTYRIALLGVCMGAVFGLRPNMIALWAAFALAVFAENLYRKKYGELVSYIVFFLAGFAGTLLAIGLWLLANGALAAWWRDGFLFNFAYAGETDMQSRMDILILFVKYRIQWISLLLNVLILCFYKKDKMLYGANLLYVAVNLVLMSMSGENYAHYKIALLPGFVAPLACGGQIIWDYIAGWKKRFRFAEPFVLATLCLAALFAKDCYRGLLRIYDNISVTEEEAAILEAMDYIKEHTDSDDKIAALGNLCHIYLGTDRYSATNYVYTFPVCNISAEMGERFCAQLLEARPKIIVMDPENFLYELEYEKRTAEFLESDYIHLMSGYHFEMFERK